MREMTVREVCVGLLMLAALGGVAGAQTAAVPEGALLESRVFVLEEMPVRKMANGGESRDVVRGALATGEVVGVHESEQPAGATPGAMHAIQHSELIVVREGTVGFEHDGKVERVGPGGVIFVAMGTLHRLKNVGDRPAKYCVMQIGGDTKK
jgi:quercetin dioxygenase-like cupin family protein